MGERVYVAFIIAITSIHLSVKVYGLKHETFEQSVHSLVSLLVRCRS